MGTARIRTLRGMKGGRQPPKLGTWFSRQGTITLVTSIRSGWWSRIVRTAKPAPVQKPHGMKRRSDARRLGAACPGVHGAQWEPQPDRAVPWAAETLVLPENPKIYSAGKGGANARKNIPTAGRPSTSEVCKTVPRFGESVQ
jgi:hypothetical protein